MKKLLVLLSLFITFALTTSCDDDCSQDALCTQVTGESTFRSTGCEKVFVCHKGKTLEISASALQAHLNHGDTEGTCETLSLGDISLEDGEIIELDCKYNLPFTHTRDNGDTWIFSEPNK